MTRDPVRSLPTAARLGGAALVCTLSLGYHVFGSATRISQAPIRLFVVTTVLGLLVAALWPRTPATQRVARAATLVLAVAIALAAGSHNSSVVMLLVLGLALAAPPAWHSPVPQE